MAKENSESERSYRMLAQHSGDEGWLSSGDADHAFVHEYIHFLHYEQVDDWKELGGQAFVPVMPPDRDIVLTHVGRYAATSGNEAVAEIGAGLWKGKTYPPEVMAIYEKFRGPPIPPETTTKKKKGRS